MVNTGKVEACGVFTLTEVVVVVAHIPASGVNVKLKVPATELSTVAGLQVPFTPLFEVEDKVGANIPSHPSGIGSNVVVVVGLIVTLNVVLVAQTPESGVKVEVCTPAVLAFTVVGIQVPLIPLSDGHCMTREGLPSQTSGIGLKVGTVFGLTVTFILVVVAHCPASGVKVKVNVPATAVFIVVGFQVPDILFVELEGKAGAEAPSQIPNIELKVGVTFGTMVILKVVVCAHCPASGVKV